jgi:DNA-binding GntR family transcriptional regulator
MSDGYIHEGQNRKLALPRFQLLATHIGQAIEFGTLEPGLILLEGPISDVFNVSRATIRNSLEILAGEGVLRKFDGRGFIVSGNGNFQPIRRRLSSNDFPSSGTTQFKKQSVADQIIADVEHHLSTAIAFGHFKIRETQLAEHYKTSRPIAREVLSRLRELGLVEKDLHSSWFAGPLSAQRVRDNHELRLLLGPYALRHSAPLLIATELEEMIQRLQHALNTVGRIGADLIDQVERDLHHRCLTKITNRKILNLLCNGDLERQIGTLFARFIGVESDDPSLGEHLFILKSLAVKNFDRASDLFARHLQNEGARVLEKLKVLAIINAPSLPTYLEKVTQNKG